MKKDLFEEIIEIKKNIESNEDDCDTIAVMLKRLGEVKVSYEDLSMTKIGKTLMKLTKNKDKSVSELASKLIEKWKKEVKKPENKEKSEKKGENKKKEENYKESYLKVHQMIKSKDEEQTRKSFKLLLFDALINKQNIECKFFIFLTYFSDSKLLQIKDIATEIEEKMYEHLHSKDDKGAKYFNKAKSIVSNIHVYF